MKKVNPKYIGHRITLKSTGQVIVLMDDPKVIKQLKDNGLDGILIEDKNDTNQKRTSQSNSGDTNRKGKPGKS